MTFCKNLFKFLVLIAVIEDMRSFGRNIGMMISDARGKERCVHLGQLVKAKEYEMVKAHKNHFVTVSDHDFLEFRARETEWIKALAMEDHCYGTFVWSGVLVDKPSQTCT